MNYLKDSESIEYIFARIEGEYKDEILKAIEYEYNSRKGMSGKKLRKEFIGKYGTEINERISDIYEEIEELSEVKLDQIRELLLLMEESEIENLVQSIEDFDEFNLDKIEDIEDD